MAALSFSDRIIAGIEHGLSPVALPRPKGCEGGVSIGFGFVVRPTPAATDPEALGAARLLIYLRANWSPRRVARNGLHPNLRQSRCPPPRQRPFRLQGNRIMLVNADPVTRTAFTSASSKGTFGTSRR